MCQFLSALVLRNGDVLTHPILDSHADLVRHFKLPDTHAHHQHFAKVELTPVEWMDVSTWQFRLDEESAPGWWDDVKDRVEATLRSRANAMILRDGDHSLLLDGCWIVGGTAKIRDVRSGRIVRLQDTGSITDVWGGIITDVYGGSITDVWGGSITAVYGGSITGVRGGSITAVYGGSITGVRGGSITAVYGGSITDVYGGSITGVRGGSITDVYGGSITDVWGGSITAVYGGSITDVWGGSITAVYGGSITDVWGGSITDVRGSATLDASAQASVAVVPDTSATKKRAVTK